MEHGYFPDRRSAGAALAQSLASYGGRDDVLVLALPRGGVPVAYEVAIALQAPLDVFVVRKLGVPGHEEYAMGALASGGVRVLSEEVAHSLGISPAQIAAVVERESRELARRELAYRGQRPLPALRGRIVIVVDDGLATGATMEAALHALRRLQPALLIAAAPVAPPEVCARLREVANDVVCTLTPEPFHAVGLWYRRFPQTSDEEVQSLLAQLAPGASHPATRGDRPWPK